jgi:hypothetical protein
MAIGAIVAVRVQVYKNLPAFGLVGLHSDSDIKLGAPDTVKLSDTLWPNLQSHFNQVFAP